MTGSMPAGKYRERNSTADRALDILMMFSDAEPVLSGAAIAERLGVARSTGYRYIQSLLTSRFLEDAPGGGFRLGLRVLEIARIARRSYSLSDEALPVMRELSENVRETVLLTRRVGDLVVCLDRAEAASRPVRISYERGSTLPINAGASALVLLAWSPPDEGRRLFEQAALQRLTSQTLVDVDALMTRLARIRDDGFSITRAEVDEDVVGIAAPIMDDADRVVAALSVAAVANRVTTAMEADFVHQVQAAAASIADRLAVVSS